MKIKVDRPSIFDVEFSDHGRLTHAVINSNSKRVFLDASLTGSMLKIFVEF